MSTLDFFIYVIIKSIGILFVNENHQVILSVR